MNKVYVLMRHVWEDSYIEGVFDTFDKAMEYKQSVIRFQEECCHTSDYFKIVESELNPPKIKSIEEN